MPIKDWTPLAELMPPQHLERFIGETLLEISDEGDPVTVSTITGPASWDTAPFDLYNLLHSRTFGGPAGGDISSVLAAGAAGASLLGTWSITLDADDKISVRSTGEAFTVSDGEFFGIATGAASSLVGGVHVCTATEEWTRGVATHEDIAFTVDGATSLNSYTLDMPNGIFQGVPELFVTYADVSDAEGDNYDDMHNATDNLSVLCQDALEDDTGAWWYRADDGKVCLVLKDGWHPDLTSDFCAWLGFDGTETGEEIDSSTGQVYNLYTATNAPGGVLTLHRALDTWEHIIFTHSMAAQAADGGVENRHDFTIHGRTVSFTLQGASRNNTPDGGRETLTSALDNLFEWVYITKQVTVYPNARERRFTGRRRQRTGRYLTTSDTYTSLSTPETFGYVGAFRGVLPLDANGQDLTLQDPRFRAFLTPVSWSLYPFIRRQGY